LSINTSSLPAATASSFYNVGLQATGGSGVYTFSATGLPAGLAVSGSNITGTATAPGNYTVVVTATETPSGASAQSTCSLVVRSPIAIATASLPSGAIATAYNASLSATGGSSTYIWSVVNQPAPLAINGGTLAGTPMKAASGSVTLTVMDTNSGISMQKDLAVAVLTDPSITTSSLPAGTAGVPYTATLSASGGSGLYTWSAPGLPTGLVLKANAITGTPTKVGTWSVTVSVTDQQTNAVAQKTFSIKVAAKSGK
jgi:hypothetical protein